MSAVFKAKRNISDAIEAYRDPREDPLTQALQPPPDETEQDRLQRLQLLRAAEQISREIDSHIQDSKKEFERRKKAIKILLLGQAESGKSSVLKNFQLNFLPKNFQSERAAWRKIIHLNVISSIKRILEVLQDEWDSASDTPRPSASQSYTPFTTQHRRIHMGLSPLLSIGNHWSQKLLPDVHDPKLSHEVCVRAGSGWKGLLGITTTTTPPAPTSSKGKQAAEARQPDEASAVLAACRDDIITLWEDPAVQESLKNHEVRLEESPGFFLDDIARITDPDYEPTDTDIVRARLRTMGVVEHNFVIERGPQSGTEWCIYDVGGSRSMRPHWIPYFDDVQAIIFLAPLCFHQVLDEDSKVNRVEDSISLWREICSNTLLAHTSIILFFNKMDILKKNLAAGMEVRRFVPSYGDKPNNVTAVVKYFRQKFQGYHKRLSPRPRRFFCHQLSAIDTLSTTKLLRGVQDGILLHHFQEAEVL